MGATNIVDFNGVTIALGATVKLVGTVTALFPWDQHFGEVQVTLTHPGPAPVSSVGPVTDVAMGQFQVTLNPNPINVAPTMLIVGS